MRYDGSWNYRGTKDMRQPGLPEQRWAGGRVGKIARSEDIEQVVGGAFDLSEVSVLAAAKGN